ncbi:MAG: aminodeoxychorismate synthase component I [Actinomycetales bacterium]|nr:aminodeoxychorismate synthase component I [Actinomycetales bacterium]
MAAVEAYLDFPWAPLGHTGRLGFGAPVAVISAATVPEVRPALLAVEAAARSGRYAVGFVSYEAAPAFDPAMRVRGGSGVPLVWFGIHDAPLPPADWREPTAYACSVWEPGTVEADYVASIAAIRAAIARGETYQVNHTMRLRARFDGDPLGAWADLRRAQRDGWFGYVDTGRHTVASVSPELFFTWDGTAVVTRPMKGTRARSRDAAVDAQRAADLLASGKDRAENLMIVDLLRNDVARVSEPGSVSVPSLFEVEAYPTVWQLTSTVTGAGRSGVGVSDLFGALFPCGSITGAPKVRTMELISDFEDRPRGVYCGASGVVWPGGSAAFNVAIRTLVVDRADGRARYDVGGGVVWDSDGADEYAEALAKSAVLDMTQRSFALMETARWEGGTVVLEDRHLDRMAASAAWFGRRFDRATAQALLRSTGDQPEAVDRSALRVRLLLAPDGALSVESTPLSTPFGMPSAHLRPVTVALATTPVWSGDPWLRHKTTRRAVYDTRRVTDPDVFDTLLWNERGELTEFTIGNLVLDLDGDLVTPPVSCGLLPGTLRAQVLEDGVDGRKVIEQVVTRADLAKSDRVWLINAVRGWVPVTVAAAPTLA